MRDTIRRAVDGSRYLLTGGLTALGCLCAFTLISIMIGNPFFGLFMLPIVVASDRWVADWERRRAGNLLGRPVPRHYVPLSQPQDPPGWAALPRTWLLMMSRALTDPATYRDAAWIMVHSMAGGLLALFTLVLWAEVVAAVSLPVQWALAATVFGAPLGDAWIWATVLAPFAVAALLWVVPLLALAEARLAALLLAPPASHRLAVRVNELTRTRAEALDAHGAELHRIERDLHDGAQAQVVSVALLLGVAERRFRDDPQAALELVCQAREGAEMALVELRDLVRGMYPPILADRGLHDAIAALAVRGPVPVSLEMQPVGRLPAAVEAATYFTVAEALTNLARHSRATHASVCLRLRRRTLTIRISDNGVGGADETRGSGLVGIRRRIGAFDGRVELSSPPGGPTILTVELPCGS